MNNANRRGFLKIAGAGAAAAGAVSLAPNGSTIAAPSAGARPAKLPTGATGSLVAYIHDVSRGEVAVMIEGREVTVTDHELVARLATAIHSASGSASA